MSYVNWEKSVNNLKTKELFLSGFAPSLLVCERKFRWQALEFENFECIPIKEIIFTVKSRKSWVSPLSGKEAIAAISCSDNQLDSFICFSLT